MQSTLQCYNVFLVFFIFFRPIPLFCQLHWFLFYTFPAHGLLRARLFVQRLGERGAAHGGDGGDGAIRGFPGFPLEDLGI